MTFTWNQRVIDDAFRMAGKGLQAATIYAANCTKEILSVPAPRVRITNKKGVVSYFAGFKAKDPRRMGPGNYDVTRAEMIWRRNYKFPKGGMGPPAYEWGEYQTAPAIRGEPPRKLSGFLRRSIAYEFLDYMKTFEGGNVATKGRFGTNAEYAHRLEFGYTPAGNHEFLGRVVRERGNDIERVLYDNATAAL